MDTELVKAALRDFLEQAGESNESLDLGVKVAVLVATADGSIDDAEMGSLAAVLSEVFGEIPEMIARVLVRDAAKHMATEDHVALGEGMGKLLAERGATLEGLRVGAAIARSSEGIADSERAVLEALARGAGAAPSALEDALG